MVALAVAAVVPVVAAALVVAAVAQSSTAERVKDAEEERYLSIDIFLLIFSFI